MKDIYNDISFILSLNACASLEKKIAKPALT